MGVNSIKRVALGFACALFSIEAVALPDFFTAWQTRYGANSEIDDASANQCQICHVSAGGGSAAGWNGYGWRLRQILNPGGGTPPTIVEALIQAGISNSDVDPVGALNITEIENGNHPGWSDGAVNEHFFANGSTTGNHLPPASLASAGIDIDPPARLDNPIPARILRGSQAISLETIASGFISPLLAIPAPGISDNLFVVDQVGIIWRVSLADGSKTRYFDISEGSLTAEATASNLVDVGNAGFGQFDERGLLGLAFHPDFEVNGRFYTYQSEVATAGPDFSTMPSGVDPDHQAVIAQWTVSDPSLAAPTVGSKIELLRVDQPQFNHDGGMIAFGSDDLLYISFGDGGSRDDEDVSIEQPGDTVLNSVTGHGTGNGSDPSNPLGAILRIDPDGANSTNGRYGIPASNPFDGSGAELAEIYAYGLRNSYRFSFDSANNDLYAADVGQGAIEEVNLIEAGGNYGWNQKEGTFSFYPNGRQAGYISSEQRTDLAMGLKDPILQYDHDEGISVTGGYVYRGTDLEGFAGAYIFADWSSDFGIPQGRLFYSTDQSTIEEFRLTGQSTVGLFVTGFGQDAAGEVYVLGNTTGTPTDATGVLQKIAVAVEGDELCFPISSSNGATTVICL